ncbi:nucleotide pyrophosphatase [Micromonospora sonchi]|uniref:Nucleotide pyrophosphatase n=1 Tax=Micromonospora sonchi TaxID=1763543 RepID=A0A917U2A1_9ACTN|nr:alkaline phosphatase family protein [Micromonospora sonchi]GGM52201.1 nucleotide pyrophosphatase [Micromonospora sonchi]
MVQTLLIGLDGATFTVLDPLMRSGVMPALRDLTQRGVRAPLRSVMPPLTPPGWTSLVTGQRPGRHGVFDFFRKVSSDGEYFRLTTAQDVATPSIWSLASAHGRKVVALNFPVMFPPPAVHGYVVPGGWMPWRQLRLGCHPPELFDQLRELPSFNPRELALDMALEAKTVEGCPDEEYADWVDLHVRREQRWFEVARHLLTREPADLVGIVFDGVDKLQHLCWRFLDPAALAAPQAGWGADITARCLRYFRELDNHIAALVDLAGPEATVILASDHGFGPTTEMFYLNAWLAQAGYLSWADRGGPVDSAAPRVGFHDMTRHVQLLDWDRTLAYAATPSSQGIHIVCREPGTDRPLPASRRRQIRDDLVADLRAARHPVTGDPLVSRIWTAEEAFAGPFEELAPDVSVELYEGAAISILRSDTVVRPQPQPKGNHRWEGIFLACGPAIRSGVTVPELPIVDVAPLVLHSLGVPVPDDLDGRVPEAVLVPGAATKPPAPPTTPPPPPPPPPPPAQPTATEAVYDSDSELVIVSRLRALGYLD